MAEIPFNFTNTGNIDTLRSLEGIVELSQVAQAEIERLAKRFDAPINGVKALIREISLFARRGATFSQSLRIIAQALGINLRQLNEAIETYRKFRKEFDRIADTTDQVNTRLEFLRNVLNGIGQGLGQAAVTALSRAFARLKRELGETVEVALEFESIISTLNRATEDGAGAFEELIEAANELGVSIRDALPNFVQLASAASAIGLPFEESLALFRNVTNAITELGLTTQQTEQIFRALTQTIGKNRLTAEELRGQLGEALPEAIVAAQEAVGAYGQEFEDLLRDGISALEFIPRFSDVLERRFVGSADSSAAALARFNNAITELRAAFGTEFINGLVSVTNALIDNKDAIIELGQAAGQAASSGLSLLANAFGRIAEFTERFRESRDIVVFEEGLGLQLTDQLQELRRVFEEAGGSAEAFEQRVVAVAETLGGFDAVSDFSGGVGRFDEEAANRIFDILFASVEQQAELARAQEAASQARRESFREEQQEQAELLALQEERQAQAELDFEATEDLLKQEQRLIEDIIEQEKDIRLEAIKEASALRLSEIQKAADSEEQVIQDRLDAEQEIAEFRFDETQKAERDLLDQRFQLTREAVALEFEVRSGANRRLAEQELEERRRIEAQIDALRSGELLDRDALELAQEILFPTRAARDIRLLSDEELRAIEELLPQIEEAQQAGLTAQQQQQRRAFEATLNSDRIIAEQEIARIRGEEERKIEQERAAFAENQRSIQAEFELNQFNLEAAFNEQQRQLDVDNAEEIAQLRVDTAERVASLEQQLVSDLSALANPIPRFTGGPMVPGQLYSFAERGPEVLRMGGKDTLVTQPSMFRVPMPAQAIPLPRYSSQTSSQSAQLASIDRGIKNLTKLVQERPIEPQIENHFVNSSDRLSDMVKVLRSQNRAYRQF